MLHRSERILDNIPVGSLGIIAVDGCEDRVLDLVKPKVLSMSLYVEKTFI